MHAFVTALHFNTNLHITMRETDQVDCIPPQYLFAHAMLQITKVFNLT